MDPHESTRQHVQEEATKEFFATDRHRPLLTSVSVVFPSEGDLAVGHVDDSVIGDGHAVCVASQVTKNMFWPSEGSLGVDHPVMAKERSQERAKGFLVGKVLGATEEGKLSFPEGTL